NRARLAVREHFDAAVRQVDRVAAHAQLTRTVRGRRAIEHALHAPADDAFLGDHAAFSPRKPAMLIHLGPRFAATQLFLRVCHSYAGREARTRSSHSSPLIS